MGTPKNLHIFWAQNSQIVLISKIMSHNIFIYGAITVYLLMMVCFFQKWLFFLKSDEQSNLEQPIFNWFFLVLASIFWPLIVPFAYLELLSFHQKHQEIIDMLINMSHYPTPDD